jgi:hypothetical protein
MDPITRPGNPFLAGAALIANMLGVPRDAGVHRTALELRQAGYGIRTVEARALAEYRRHQAPFQASSTEHTAS